jgi:hypothetical protein
MDDFVSLCIPDSVEVLTGVLRKCERRNRLLHFGGESRLMKICLNSSDDDNPSGRAASEVAAVFICLSEGAMKRFRCHFEAF